MAITQNTYTGDGSTVLFSFTFPYLEETDIKVTLDGVLTTAYSLANATTIQMDAAPANGVALRIYRETDDAALAATFYPGSAIRSQDLNENFTQNLYVTQESNREAAQAVTTSNAATVTANAAVVTADNAVTIANAATVTANTASTNASAAVATANTADTNASAAVITANTAETNAAAAVVTANSAAADATTAISTANGAVSTANGAVTTANSAATDAATAIATADSAATDAATAIATADSAAADAAAAVITANTADTNASAAVVTANTADGKADQAIAAVASALLFTIVVNVAAIPASPVDGDAVEVTDSTGIESFTPLANLPVGFVGDSGLGVRIIYDGTNSTWNWLQYFAQDPDNRYAGPNTNAGTATAPSIAFGPTDTDTGIYSPGANEIAIATGGNVRLTIDSTGTVNVADILEAEVLGARQSLALIEGGGVNGLFLKAPASMAAPVFYTLPGVDGSDGQVLKTDGSGNLTWTSDVSVLVTDGGNFDNGSTTLETSVNLDGGQF